jgi:hypothetical protein
MVLVDGDDSLVGRQVFALLNAFYQNQKPALVYTQMIWIKPGRIVHSFNLPIRSRFLREGTWRSQKKFITSHLKTMYVDLFRMIKK